ncbi:MAG: hypothetical protein JST75_20470 [Bacteroidetes bacterium]|nr:hypothetical protein [Bacteroidota bacterium]
MKLTKFELEKMPIAETIAIKAGSGVSDCWQGHTSSTGSDHDSNGGDSD